MNETKSSIPLPNSLQGLTRAVDDVKTALKVCQGVGTITDEYAYTLTVIISKLETWTTLAQEDWVKRCKEWIPAKPTSDHKI